MANDLATQTASVLTKSEVKDLATCEEAIERGRKTVFEVGMAMARIRDGRLYRGTHETFEAYCRERWDSSKQHAGQLIGAAEVHAHLGKVNDRLPLPSNVEQARPLLALRSDDGGKGTKRVIDLEEVEKVWEEVVERAPKDEDGTPHITGKHVKETVDWWQADDEPDEEENEEEEEEENSEFVISHEQYEAMRTALLVLVKHTHKRPAHLLSPSDLKDQADTLLSLFYSAFGIKEA